MGLTKEVSDFEDGLVFKHISKIVIIIPNVIFFIPSLCGTGHKEWSAAVFSPVGLVRQSCELRRMEDPQGAGQGDQKAAKLAKPCQVVAESQPQFLQAGWSPSS